MNQNAADNLQALLDQQIKDRFPDGSVTQVELRRYGDDPEIEPGRLLVRVHVEPPGEPGADDDPMDDWEHAHRALTRGLHDQLSRKVPEVSRIEFVMDTAKGRHTSRIGMLNVLVSDMEERARSGGGPLTPVMARLAAVDLETLDTLITAGIAPTRAEAVRWALARIRERPAYEQIVARTREIEELKAQF